MKLRPLGDRVVIKPNPVDEKTQAGIIIPDSAKQRPQEGVIIAVGEGTADEAMFLQVDDVVLYGKHSGTPVVIEDAEFLLMRQSDVLCVISQ